MRISIYLLVLFASISAFADFSSFPEHIDMRCGPAEGLTAVTFSTKPANVLVCEDTFDASGKFTGATLKMTGPLFVTVGQNRYKANLRKPLSAYTCATPGAFEPWFDISDQYGEYQIGIHSDGHAVIRSGPTVRCTSGSF